MEPTYFTYRPIETNRDEAYQKAKPFLASDSVIMVTPNSVVGHHIEYGLQECAWKEDTFLVRVNADGSLETIGYRGADL